MINEFVIKINPSVSETGKVTMPIEGVYFDKLLQRNIYLTTNYKVVHGRELIKDVEKVFKFKFMGEKSEFKFSWDSNDKDKNEWANAWKQHPDIQNTENKNQKTKTYFILFDKSKQATDTFERENGKVVVWNMVKNMQVEELMDVAYFNYVNPIGKKAIDIFLELCSLTSGLLAQNPDKFISEWKLSDSQYRVIIRKAIILNIIEAVNGVYMINKAPIGNVDNLIVYMKDNDKYYQYLKAQVAEKDILPYGLTENISVEEALSSREVVKELKIDARTKTDEQKENDKLSREMAKAAEIDAKKPEEEEKARLRKILKDANVRGWHLDMKVETMREKVSKLELVS